MDNNNNRQKLGRDDLAEYFKDGTLPSENNFRKLIDSVLNILDDGFTKTEDGLEIKAIDKQLKLMTFYKNLSGNEPPFFSIEIDDTGKPCLVFRPYHKPMVNTNNFYFGYDGTLGIGKKGAPGNRLDVAGFISSEGRLGTYSPGREIIANGKWQTIADGLNKCNAFEIVARAGNTGSGKFAMLHAIAVSAYGTGHNKIKKVCAHYGFFWNKISLRWRKGIDRSGLDNYLLEMRTNRNYGNDVKIKYSITRLWDDDLAG